MHILLACLIKIQYYDKIKKRFSFFFKLVRCEGFPFFGLGKVGKVGLIPGGLRPGTKLTGYLLMTLIHFDALENQIGPSF